MNSKRKYTSMKYIFIIIQLCLLIGLIQGLILLYILPVIGSITSIIIIGVAIYLFKMLTDLNKKFQTEIKEKVDELSDTKKDMFVYSTMPVVILDSVGTIWWYNEAFGENIAEEDMLNKSIRSLFTEIQLEDLPKEEEQYEKMVACKDKYFNMVCQRICIAEAPGNFNYAIYFEEKTIEEQLKKQVEIQKPIIGYVCIDNYEELMKSIEEVRRPMLAAVIDRKLNIWFKDTNSILRKYEKDKYIIFCTKQDLEGMQEKKFDILDQLRNTQVGNELPVTISIGMGRNVDSLFQSKEDAQAAFELAQGRGGDQAVIKNRDKYTFYGGKTKEVEKSTRVKARVKAYAFKELLVDADQVYIMGHKNIDMDCLGAAMGVYRAAKILGKEAYIVLDEPTFAIKALYDRIVESKEYEDLFISCSDAQESATKDTLMVIVDVHRKSYLEEPKLLDSIDNIVIFDHHRRSTDFIEDAVLTYIEPFVSSTCEMLAEILSYLTDKVKLTQIEADALLAGITIDTKNFVTKSGVRTFEAAAFLRRAGADSTRVRMLFQTDMDVYKVRASAIKDSQIWFEDIAISHVEGNHEYVGVITAQVADELLDIRGIRAAFVLAVTDENISISARALNDDINVQVMMEALGGGGHKNVAGAQLSDTSIYEAKARLKQVIANYLEEGE